MKKHILTLCVAILTVLALVTGACAEGAFDGLEGVVILTPDEGQDASGGIDIGSSASAADAGSGLALTLSGGRVEMAGDTYSNIIFDARLMNWEIESYPIADSVQATLYYQEEYPFSGAFDFGEDAEIGMLVEETGTLTFSVPHIVAMANVENLRLELTVLEDSYDQELTPLALPEEYTELSIPFDYAARETDALELKLGNMVIREKYKGDSDEKFKWILQDFSLINWSEGSQNLGETTSILLAYAGKYGFQGEISYGQESIDPLEVVHCRAVFHVPNIVAEAGPETLSLQITLSGEQTEQAYDPGKAVEFNPYAALKEVFDYENPNALRNISEHMTADLSSIMEWNDHLYLIVEAEDGYCEWDEARANCEAMGGHLVAIETAEEQEALAAYLTQKANKKNYWMGGHSDGDGWTWITGVPVEYLNWDSGEPNGNGAYMQIYDNGFWDDTRADDHGVKAFICEWEF